MLPLELFQDIIFYYLQPNDVMKLSLVSKSFYKMTKEQDYWNSLFSFPTNGIETFKMIKKLNMAITENALRLVLKEYSGNEQSFSQCVDYANKKLKPFVILDVDIVDSCMITLHYFKESLKRFPCYDFWNTKNNVIFVKGRKVVVKNYNEDLYYKFKRGMKLSCDEEDFLFSPEDNRCSVYQQQILNEALHGLM